MTVPARAVVAPPGPGMRGLRHQHRPPARPAGRAAAVPGRGGAAAVPRGRRRRRRRRPHRARVPQHQPRRCRPGRARRGDSARRNTVRARRRPDVPDVPDNSVVRLHCPHDLRAVVVADAVARVLRCQGALVRVTAEGFDREWTAALGVRVDGVGPAPVSPPVTVRPVPAPPTPAPGAGRRPLGPAPPRRPRPAPDRRRTPRPARGQPPLPGAVRPCPQPRPDPQRRRSRVHRRARPGAGRSPGAPGRPWRPPRVLAAAAAHRAPDRIARHLVAVADAALPFLPTVLPRGGEKPSAATAPGWPSPKPPGRCWQAA